MPERIKYGQLFVIQLHRAVGLIKTGTALRRQFSILRASHELCDAVKDEFEETELINSILTHSKEVIRVIEDRYTDTYFFQAMKEDYPAVDQLYDLTYEIIDLLPSSVIVPVLKDMMIKHRI